MYLCLVIKVIGPTPSWAVFNKTGQFLPSVSLVGLHNGQEDQQYKKNI